ncbi:Amidohydrolase 3 [Cellulomonas flavigena DSM 20109]|uniref:Amidohydrolase 3 n=1 Tax=Cellulomonas flavigena (strain ATCC 482 / DSM 20109 / BCRC 11376 / JCM 18109 / NBRC 3775 / NCIMB 8073 / NRS 134) TaxID=446466 RepID=D5UKH8_CELFN|nr:Amidohydrolase 3 [Cellulomonas flavigena DSM 20109]
MDVSRPLVLRRARLLGQDAPVDVVLRDGRIASLGVAAAGVGDVVDLDGRLLLPGLWDQHTHLTQWALARGRLDVSGAESAAQAVALVAERLRTSPPAPGRPLVGLGFRDGTWPDAPSAALLDAVAGDVPVVLVSGDLHCAWASTAGIRLLGVAQHPTGVLRETEWMPLMGALDHVPDAEQDALVADALRAAAARGVVGVVDLEIADNVAVWRRRAAAGDPPVRVRAGVWPAYLDRVVGEDLHTGDRVAGPRVTQGPLKVIVDGSLNTRTAWCHDPYPGVEGDLAHGVLNVPPDELVPLLRHAGAHGLRAAVHAIGDAANALVLDAFATTGAQGSVEHAQLLTPADVTRFAELGVVASVQPAHAPDDRDVADRHWAGRTHRAFPLADLHAAGVTLALGSDAPVAPLDPWLAIDAAVWRTADERPPWHPEQRLDVRTALASSVDGRPLGLRVGDPADLVVLEDDPTTLAATPGGLRATRVAATLVAGTVTHTTL